MVVDVDIVVDECLMFVEPLTKGTLSAVYLALSLAVPPVPLHQGHPVLQMSPLQLQPLDVLLQGTQADPQVLPQLLALPQGLLSSLPPPEQGHEPRLVPALQRPHAAAQPPLQAEGRPTAVADVAEGPGQTAGRLSGLIPQAAQLVPVSLPEL